MKAWLFDGRSPVRQDVEVTAVAGEVTIDGEPVDGLEAVEHQHGVVYGRRGITGWRLTLAGAPPADLAALLPPLSRYGHWVDRLGLPRAFAAFAVISGLVVAALLTAPRWIAPLIPLSWEKRLGDAVVGDLGGKSCRGPGGEHALAALVTRLDQMPGDLKVRVVPIPLVNAVALPGGNIVIFDGLLRQSKSADELAGVLAHEIGHVRNRDTMRALLQQAGLSVLLGGFNPQVGGNLNVLLTLSYTREAESKADGYAIDLLRRAQISPRDTAALFARLNKIDPDEGGFFTYLASHPTSQGRAARFAGSADQRMVTTPALRRDQWDALADICHNDPRAKQSANDWKPF